MQQVASERQREEKLLARQAKLIPVAFSGPRPRQVSRMISSFLCLRNRTYGWPEDVQDQMVRRTAPHNGTCQWFLA